MRTVLRATPLFFVFIITAPAAAAPHSPTASSPSWTTTRWPAPSPWWPTETRCSNLEAVGYADVDAKKPMKTDALFWIASMSKPMTATALMMLVDEGKVKLDDPVEKYLPEFKDQWLSSEQDKDHILLKKPKHPITVRNILRHTSGLPSNRRWRSRRSTC